MPAASEADADTEIINPPEMPAHVETNTAPEQQEIGHTAPDLSPKPSSSWDWLHYVGFALLGYFGLAILLFMLWTIIPISYFGGANGVSAIVGAIVAVILVRQYKNPEITFNPVQVMGFGLAVVIALNVVFAVLANVNHETVSTSPGLAPPVRVAQPSATASTIYNIPTPTPTALQQASFHFNRAMERGKAKMYRQAIYDLKETIRLDPTNAEAFYYKGLAHKELKEHQKAIADYNEAIRLNPNNYKIFNDRGYAFVRLGQYEEAIEDFSEAIRLDPNFADGFVNSASAYNILGHYQKAIDNYSEAIRLIPADAEVFSNRGNSYFHLAKYEEAIEDFSEAIRLDPTYAHAYYNRGVTNERLGKYGLANMDFAKAKKYGYEP